MGTPRQITVNWDASINGPVAQDVTLTKTEGATTLTWQAGRDVSNITISGLPDTMFTTFTGQGTDTVSCTDENSDLSQNEYSYTISATHTSGLQGSHDPKIINGSRGGTGVAKPRSRKPDVQP